MSTFEEFERVEVEDEIIGHWVTVSPWKLLEEGRVYGGPGGVKGMVGIYRVGVTNV